MSLNVNLASEKNEFGKYDARIVCTPTGGEEIAFGSIMGDSSLEAVYEAIECLSHHTPNFDQDELTKTINSQNLVPWPDGA